MAGPGSELRVNASVGQVAGISGELYKPLIAGKRYFVSPRAYYARTVSAFYSGSQQLAQYTEQKNGFGVDLGYIFNSKTELRFGEDYQWYSEKLRIGTPIEQAFQHNAVRQQCAVSISGAGQCAGPDERHGAADHLHLLHAEPE